MVLIRRRYPEICKHCGGEGKIYNEDCPVCGGSGSVIVTEERIGNYSKRDEIQTLLAGGKEKKK